MRALGAQSTRTALALSIRVIRASIISRLRCVSGAAVGFERFERAGERGIVRAREKAEKTLGPEIQHPRFPRCRARARLGTAACCHGADRPFHH